MARDISIAYSARDQISPALNSMRNSNKLFNKDLEETQQKIENLNRRQDSLTEGLAKSRGKLDETSGALRQAKKDYEQYGEVLGKDYLSKFYQDHEEAKQQVKDFESAIKSTRKEINGLSDDMNRAGNRAGGFGGTESGMMSSLAKAGLGKMIGDSLTGAVQVGIGSAFGSNAGDAINTMLSGALGGAAMGFVAGGPVGALIGAGAGLTAGGIGAATGYFEKQDDAFRSVVQDLVENELAELTAGLERGMPIASSREGNIRRLDALGADNSNLLNNTLIEIGRTPPFSYDTAMELTGSMMGLGVSVTDAVDRINSLADAAAALNISESGISTIVTQLETVQMTGTIDTRVMRSMMRQGINPYEALAEMFNVDGNEITPDEVANYLPDLDADMFVDAMYKYMGMRFEGAAAGMSETYSGISGIMQSYQEDMDAAQAQGFMDARVGGMSEQVQWMSGESGENMKEANRMIGEWQASLENEKERILREHMEAAMGSEDYQKALAEENGAEAGRILAQAQIDAQAAYNASDGAQAMVRLQEELIEQTAQTLADDPKTWNAGFIIGEAYSKGMMAALNAGWTPEVVVWGSGNEAAGVMGTSMADSMKRALPGDAPGNAWGISRVPYDNYMTRLHEGERVLTASEARSQDRGSGSTVINVNNPIVREETDIYKIAQALATELKKASLIS